MKRISFLILSICLLFLSCKRDPPIITPAQDCVDISKIPPVTDTVYNTPRFNPANSNEIIYVQGNNTDNKIYLVKKNLATGHETYIISDVWQMPDWSIKDWIVFNHADNQVWKIKSNGDSLTLLTTNMQGGFYAVWSPDGNKIAYNAAGIPYTMITDAKGNYLDSLPYFINYLTRWSNNGLYICGEAKDYLNIVYQNVYTGQSYQPTNLVLDANAANMMAGDPIDWTPDSQYIIWANPFGLYKTNIATKQTILLKTLCNGRFYTSLSVSPDGKKIIAQRLDVQSGLCLMDIDGKNEVIIK